MASGPGIAEGEVCSETECVAVAAHTAILLGMATELDVEFNLDETLTISCACKDPNGGALNLAGLSGDDIQWGISASKGGPRLATLAIGTGITVNSTAAGTITIAFPAASQDALTARKTYYHECRVNHGTYGVSIQFEGKAKVLESIFATT